MDGLNVSLHPLLPCARCRVMERAAGELKGWAPRRHQAEVLLSAGEARKNRTWPYPDPGVTFDPERDDPAITRSEKEKLYEAARALRDRGLLFARPPRNRSKGGKSTLWRTPLGQAVVDRHAEQLRKRQRGDTDPLHLDRDALAEAARLETERLREIFQRRERDAPDFGDPETPEMSDDEWFLFGATLASRLLDRDELDERQARRAERWQGADKTRAMTAELARQIRSRRA